MLRAFFLFTILVIGTRASAFNCMHRGLQEQVKDMVHNASWVEEPGELGRRTTKQYAEDHSTARKVTEAEVVDRFAATGLLNCNGYKGTAQLSGDESTISTSAHNLIDSKTCKKRPYEPTDCTFTVTTSKGQQKVDVSGVFGMGFSCPAKPKISDDWAVLKLKNPIKGVKPYRLPKPNEKLKFGEKIVSVNAHNDDVFEEDNLTGKKVHPKTIEDCSRKLGHYDPVDVLYVESTCDVAGGASGGSILKADDDGDILMALHKGNDDTDEEKAAGKRGDSVRKPYKEASWASYDVLVTGRLLETLAQATKPKR